MENKDFIIKSSSQWNQKKTWTNAYYTSTSWDGLKMYTSAEEMDCTVELPVKTHEIWL